MLYELQDIVINNLWWSISPKDPIRIY